MKIVVYFSLTYGSNCYNENKYFLNENFTIFYCLILLTTINLIFICDDSSLQQQTENTSFSTDACSNFNILMIVEYKV